MISVVLDTNVLAPGLANQSNAASKLGEIVRPWLHGDFAVVASEHLIEEVRRGLATQPYFRIRLTESQRNEIEALLADLVRIVDAGEVVLGVAPHRHDDPVLAAVAVSGADWFATGDAALLAMGSYAGRRPVRRPVRLCRRARRRGDPQPARAELSRSDRRGITRRRPRAPPPACPPMPAATRRRRRGAGSHRSARPAPSRPRGACWRENRRPSSRRRLRPACR